MIRLKWADGEREVTKCDGCPHHHDPDPYPCYCGLDRDVSCCVCVSFGLPPRCPLLTLEVERENGCPKCGREIVRVESMGDARGPSPTVTVVHADGTCRVERGALRR